MVKCHHCRAEIRSSNMSRHVRSEHGEESSQVNLQRSTSCSEDPDAGTPAPPSIVLQRSGERSESESVENESELMSSCEVEEDRRRSVFVRAAAEVLDRHQDFSEKSLLRFLAESFPEIEKNQRLRVVDWSV